MYNAAYLDAYGVAHSRQEVHVCVIRLSGALAHPQQVRGAVVPAPRDAVPPRQRLLVGQQQALMRCVEGRLRKHRGPRVNADGAQEGQALVHSAAQVAVLAAGG